MFIFVFLSFHSLSARDFLPQPGDVRLSDELQRLHHVTVVIQLVKLQLNQEQNVGLV